MADPQEDEVPVLASVAARKLGVDKRFIYRRLADGTLKGFRLKGSNAIRVYLSDVDKLKDPVVYPQ